jgi:DNA repair protein SbcD/Mre11
LYKFVHMSDCHLGFQKSKPLQAIEQNIFEKILDDCIEKKVDFVLISGDLFHTSLPEFRVQRFAFKKFKEVYDAGIPIYVVYGSHDFNPVGNSLIELLSDVGYFTKVTKEKDTSDDKISLEFFQDPSTKAKIIGLPGLTSGKDIEYYKDLNRKNLEKENGFKIFLFHAGIDELKTKDDALMDSMPASLLPRGFDYYAGGHVHTHSSENYEDYGIMMYSGTIFDGHSSDIEKNARGTKRGYVLVEFDDKIKNWEFVPIHSAEYEIIEINAKGKSTTTINSEISKKIEEIDPSNKIVIMKIRGELISGKTTEIDFSKIKEGLLERGAIEVKINNKQLTSKEYTITPARGEGTEEIINNIFKENIGDVKLKQEELLGDSGFKIAQELLNVLGVPKSSDESKNDYQNRIKISALEILGLEQNAT